MLIGDMNDSSTLTTGDATGLLRFISGAAGGFPAIPALPTGLTPTFGADPEIFIPKNLTVTAGNSVTVPINIRVTEATGVSVAGIDVSFTYDSNRFTIGAVTTGEALTGFTFSTSSNTATPGFARIVYAASAGPAFAHGFVGTLLNVTLTAKVGAASGASAINLTSAGASDNDTNDLTIAPAITSGVDSSDGVITVPGVPDSAPIALPLSPASLAERAGANAANMVFAIPLGSGLGVTNGTSKLSPTNGVRNVSNQLGHQETDTFFRMLGDSIGNGVVSITDAGASRAALSNIDAAFDFDSEGVVIILE